MLLSIQQQYILDVLEKLGCIHKRQLLVMMREKFRKPDLIIGPDRLEFMLRQLRSGTNSLRLEDDLVLLYGTTTKPLHFEAIDIMLELAEGTPLSCCRALEVPFLLRFSIGSEVLRLFSVAELAPPFCPGTVERRRMERIIWISSSGSPPEGLALPRRHFFAVRQQDGTHRFYGSNEP